MSQKHNKSLTEKVKNFLLTFIPSVILLTLIYSFYIYYVIPEFNFPLQKTQYGEFGDSFGVLTSIFTGLAFVGLLITIRLQREDLELNRKELEETRLEFKEQNFTFQRQRFDDVFYRQLVLYKENLKELVVTDNNQVRRTGIEALKVLLQKFTKEWGSHRFTSFPTRQSLKLAYCYLLIETVKTVFISQSRYLATVSNILHLIHEEKMPEKDKQMYCQIFCSQLTVYEFKYLFYQSMNSQVSNILRGLVLKSDAFMDRLTVTGILKTHKQAFSFIWGIDLPSRKAGFVSPLTAEQINIAKLELKKRIPKPKPLKKKLTPEIDKISIS